MLEPSSSEHYEVEKILVIDDLPIQRRQVANNNVSPRFGSRTMEHVPATTATSSRNTTSTNQQHSNKSTKEKHANNNNNNNKEVNVFRLVVQVALVVAAISSALGCMAGKQGAATGNPGVAVTQKDNLQEAHAHDNNGTALANVGKPQATITNQQQRGKTYTGATQDPSSVPIHEKALHLMSATKQQQIDTFQQGKGLIINFHIVHHGGTTMCSEIGRRMKAPSFACLNPREPQDAPVGADFPRGKNSRPWSYNETANQIAIVHDKYHYDFISWEFGQPVSGSMPQMEDTHWEHAQLVSVIVTRDPMSRLLAGDGKVNDKYPRIKNGTATQEDWWHFAHDDRFTDNFALRVLAGRNCCNGTHTDPLFLEHAKALLDRFTFILDVSCLDAGIAALGATLGLNMSIPVKKQAKADHHQHRQHPRDRIGYPDVYDYLVDKNRMDIALYEWSKTRSLVNCADYEQATSGSSP